VIKNCCHPYAWDSVSSFFLALQKSDYCQKEEFRQVVRPGKILYALTYAAKYE